MSATRIPGISHEVKSIASLIREEELGEATPPNPEDLVYREGSFWPMSREKAEELHERQANIGRPGYNEFGIKIDHSLPPCSKGVCPINAPRYAEKSFIDILMEEPQAPKTKLRRQLEELSRQEGIMGALASGFLNFKSAAEEKKAAIGKALRRRLRPWFGIAEREPEPQMTQSQEAKYPKFKKWMDSLPPAVPWQESPRLMREIERAMLKRACEMHNCKGPETLQEEQERLSK